MARQTVKALLNSTEKDIEVSISAWVRTKRGSKNVAFIAVNDGSTPHNLQIVVDLEKMGEAVVDKVTTGSCIKAIGKLVESQGSGQKYELEASSIEVLGEADANEYPLQPKKHSLEFLRENAHLRFRTSTFSAVSRIRHTLIFAVHNFFNSRGFYNIHTPIITGSDAEGAGETFNVSTLDKKNPPLTEEGEIDYKKDFFGKLTNLTVSGQLEAEAAAMALGKVYTFGPTFRAENSNTTRHLAEFWMIEPEVAFNELEDNIDLAEDFMKYLIAYTLENCHDDLVYLENRIIEEEKNKKAEDRQPMNLIEKLKFVVDNDFERLTYTEAIEILRNSKPNKKKKFQYPVEGFGTDLQSEHERYLVEKHFKKPVVLTDYPKEIKAFYMRQNEDGKTVRAMDILFPGIGEMVGGSQREERLDLLVKRMEEMHIEADELWWYLELRKFGTAPHSGFGLGFERLVQFVTGMGNIRDVIPFPRTPKSAEF
ncbi:asparagine--tRNA ligase [Acidiluteibacter ferrifornacis]|uniref:Asparagine--tRNA ligase n=1 Tax=Acidiluteibacter ferrifornacis TaxID=2692424 RepID=A0A6N9NDZ7_9FLAO|nr:asparagine--tRNA ligase [Acidiluteibacter ferrifornacis]NBG64846.1 asparagine--tRNA ligase [Acidiluteibacter ferrifornacis]